MNMSRSILTILLSVILTGCVSGQAPNKENSMTYVEIPALDPKGKVHKTLAAADMSVYHESIGKLTTAFVFVDFPDNPGKDNTEKLAKEITADGRAQMWYQKQSFGKMSMDFVIPSKEWRTMSKSPKEYESRTSK